MGTQSSAYSLPPPPSQGVPTWVVIAVAVLCLGIGWIIGTRSRPDPLSAIGAAEYYFERFSAAGPVFALALETGLRRGDLLALTWHQVDLGAGWIRLVTSKRREPAVIAISSRCRAALEDLRDRPRHEEGAPASFRRRRADRPVCVDLEGEPFSVTTIRRYFATAKELAGITRRLRFHDLRHTFASDLVTAGIPEAWIRKAMGQRDDRSLRRYAKTRDEGLKAIAAALDRKLP